MGNELRPHPEGLASIAPIIVTATRRSEPAETLPISIATVGGNQLESSRVLDLADLSRLVPNLTHAATGVLGVGQLSIRGIHSPVGPATVGLYVDDVPIHNRPLGFSGHPPVPTFDLDRVEVLRGPQGTLFGASSLGGTVRLITRQPDLERFSGRAIAEVGATEGGEPVQRAAIAAGGPLLASKIGVRTSISWAREGGYVDKVDPVSGEIVEQDIDDRDQVSIRTILTAQLGPAISVTPSFAVHRVERADLPLFESGRRPFQQSFLLRQPGEDELLLASLVVRGDLGGATLTSSSAWMRRVDRQTSDYSTVFGELVLGGLVPGLVPEGGTRNTVRTGQTTLAQEVRLVSSDAEAPLRWIAGAFAEQTRYELAQRVSEPGIAELTERFFGAGVEAVFGTPLLPGGISYAGDERLEETQLALFGETNWRLGGGFEATAGVRVSRSTLDVAVRSRGPYAGGDIVQETGASDETAVTPRFALSYAPAERIFLYATASRGFRPGGANPPVPAEVCADDLKSFGQTEAPVTFGSDSVWNYEFGAKASTPGRRLTVQGALFHIEWSDVQQLVHLPNCGFSFIANLGQARSRGFEAEAQFRPVPSVLLSAALGYADARYTAALLGGNGEVIAVRGDRLTFAPDWSANVAGEYGFRIAGDLSGFIHGAYRYTGDYQRTPAAPALGHAADLFRGSGYGHASLRAGTEYQGWTVSLFLENLFDARPVLFRSADLVPATRSPLRQTSIRPRTIGLSVLGRF